MECNGFQTLYKVENKIGNPLTDVRQMGQIVCPGLSLGFMVEIGKSWRIRRQKFGYVWISLSLRNIFQIVSFPWSIPFWFNIATYVYILFYQNMWKPASQVRYSNQITLKNVFGLFPHTSVHLVCLATFPIFSLFVYRIYSRYYCYYYYWHMGCLSVWVSAATGKCIISFMPWPNH